MCFSKNRAHSERFSARSYSSLLKNFMMPLGDYLCGQKMIKRLGFLERAQWWDFGRLEVERNKLLRKTINIVYSEVPFYRDVMQSRGIKPDDISCPADLTKLPVFTKDMLRPGYPALITRDTGSKTYEFGTSGSTGKNFFVRHDAETLGWFRASLLLALQWAGWQLGERHVQTGIAMERSFTKRLKDLMLRCHYVSAFDMTDAHLDQTLDFLERKRIEHLWGYPASLYFLARRAMEQAWNRPLRSLVTWGDNLYPTYRNTIEKGFKARVFDNYGCGEGMWVSAQCGQENTYHIHSLDVVVEFLDDEGNPVPHGQPANIVLTRLHAGPTPIIRYRVGDVGVRGQNGRCPCGRAFEMMGCIQGRDTDVVITPSGNRLIVHFFTGILEHFPEIKCFQVIQDSMDSMLLRVVPADNYTPEVSSRAVAKLKQMGASDMNIVLEVVNHIPLSPAGKRRFVISKVGREFRNKQEDNGF